MDRGCRELNDNPTYYTFLATEPWEAARRAAAQFLNVDAEQLLLVQNTSQGLHLLLNSFLLGSTDELLTTNHEHGCVTALMRHLKETRGVKTTVYDIPEWPSDTQVAAGIMKLMNADTRVILVSEIDGYTGQRYDWRELAAYAKQQGVLFLLDAAHSCGQVSCRPSDYPLWVTSGHKWLGGPNGTGLVYVAPHLVPQLKPVWLGDKHFELKDADLNDLRRFESQGTCDVIRWCGFTAAIELQTRLRASNIYEREKQLLQYLVCQLELFKPIFKRDPANLEPASAMIAFHWNEDRLRVPNLYEALMEEKIVVRPDLLGANRGAGMRVSCHYSVNESDIDRFIAALSKFVHV